MLETRFPPIREVVKLPVFDINTLTNMVYSAVLRQDFATHNESNLLRR